MPLLRALFDLLLRVPDRAASRSSAALQLFRDVQLLAAPPQPPGPLAAPLRSVCTSPSNCCSSLFAYPQLIALCLRIESPRPSRSVPSSAAISSTCLNNPSNSPRNRFLKFAIVSWSGCRLRLCTETLPSHTSLAPASGSKTLPWHSRRTTVPHDRMIRSPAATTAVPARYFTQIELLYYFHYKACHMLVRQPLLYGWRRSGVSRLSARKSSHEYSTSAAFTAPIISHISRHADPSTGLVLQVIIPPPQHPCSPSPTPVRPIRQTRTAAALLRRSQRSSSLQSASCRRKSLNRLLVALAQPAALEQE